MISKYTSFSSNRLGLKGCLVSWFRDLTVPETSWCTLESQVPLLFHHIPVPFSPALSSYTWLT